MERVRLATIDDAAQIAALYAPYILETPISFEEVPPSIDEMCGRIEATLQKFPFLVFEDDRRIMGYANAGAHRDRAAYRWSANVGIMVGSGHHRRGIGRRLYTELFEILRRQGYHAAFAGIALPNENSVGLHQALGFSAIGTYAEVGFKFGQWWDVGWWRLELNPGLPTGEPIPFPELRAL